MTSQGGNKSKLAEIQMRFQLRQQQEREQRKSEMAMNSINTSGKSKTNNDTDTIVMTTTTEKIQKKILSSSIGPGKVRQMFDERRQRGTGIDKSYPLKPIQGLSTRTNVQSTTNQRQHISTNSKQANTITTSTIRQKSDSFNANVKTYNIFEQDNIDNNAFLPDLDQIPDKDFMRESSQSIQSSNLGKQQATITKMKDENVLDNYNKNNNVNVANNQTQNNSNLKPVITKKEPPTELLNRTFKSNKKITSKTNNENDPKRSPTTPSLVSPKSTKNTQSKLELKTMSSGNINNNGLSSCRICDRNFKTDRLEKHEQICEKMAKKKRKTYDAVKHRVAGTEAEKYVKNTKNRTNTVAKANAKSYTNSVPATTTKTNWRKTHEDFINAIRAAKQVKAHLAKGGKLSDLPPPPPTEHLDYVQCPHCNRKFNQSAAERHIPKCATFLHNKPKQRSPKIAAGLKQRH